MRVLKKQRKIKEVAKLRQKEGKDEEPKIKEGKMRKGKMI